MYLAVVRLLILGCMTLFVTDMNLSVAAAQESTASAPSPPAPPAPPELTDEQWEKMLSVPVGPTDEVPGLQVHTLEKFEAGNIAWVLTGAAACLFLVAPGLVLFYCALLDPRDLTTRATQYLALAAAMTLIWVLWAYSFSFARNTKSLDARIEELEAPDRTDLPGNLFIGGWDHVLLRGIESQMGTAAPRYPLRRPVDHVPHVLFVMYQLGFYIAVPAPLIVGLARRLRFAGLLLFTALWTTLVYAPITYWLWGGGWLTRALDTSGGIAAHVAVGFAALAVALALPGGSASTVDSSSRRPLAVLGTVLFWAGWMIWSGTRTLAADGYGADAFLSTHLAGCMGMAGWAVTEWLMRRRPDWLACCAGPIAGMITMAAGSGYVAPQSAMITGTVGGMVACLGFHAVQRWAALSPLWSVFALHALPGALGALLAAVFATSAVGGYRRDGSPLTGLLLGSVEPFIAQLIAVAAAAALAVVGTLITLLLVRVLGGMSDEGGRIQDRDVAPPAERAVQREPAASEVAS